MSGKGLPFTPPRCDKYLVQTLLMCRRVGGWVWLHGGVVSGY